MGSRLLYLAVLVAAFAGGFGFVSGGDKEDTLKELRDEVMNLKAKLLEEQGARVDAQVRLRRTADEVGFLGDSRPYGADPAKIRAAIEKALKRFRSGLRLRVRLAKYPVQQDGGVLVGADDTGLAEVAWIEPGWIPTEATLEALLGLQDEVMGRMLEDLRAMAGKLGALAPEKPPGGGDEGSGR